VKGFVQYRQFLVLRPSDAPEPQVREKLDAFAQEQKDTATVDGRSELRRCRRSWWPFGQRSD